MFVEQHYIKYRQWRIQELTLGGAHGECADPSLSTGPFTFILVCFAHYDESHSMIICVTHIFIGFIIYVLLYIVDIQLFSCYSVVAVSICFE